MQLLEQPHLFAALRAAASAYPDRTLTLYDGRCREKMVLSLAALLDVAEIAASRYLTLGVGAGDRVIVSLANSLEWYAGWLGAIRLGALPVAASPGFALGSAAYQEKKIFDLGARLQAKVLLASDTFASRASEADAAVNVISSDTLLEGARTDLPDIPAGQGTAYLQLTSGSTGAPKAAQVTHAGLLHNISAFFAATARRRGGHMPETGVFWLPLYHDFGLVTTLGCLLHGMDLHVFPPRAFLSRPSEWWRLATQYPAVMTAAPNFAYQHAIDKIPAAKRAEIDMGQVHTCMMGAEMNHYETIERFAEAFADSGFTPGVFAPAYGMAETTLVVTMDQTGAGPHVATAMVPPGDPVLRAVTCGAPIADTDIRVQTPDGVAVPEGTVGHVEVRCPGVVDGYFEDPEASADAIQDGWLATGDLGFLKDGQLYITGRAKEVLILQGTNYTPHEFEWLAETEAGGGMIRAGAFSTTNGSGSEQAVLVVETDRGLTEAETEALRDRIAARIGRELGVSLEVIEFVPRGAIPRTTSGKLQRRALREAYEAGRLHLEQTDA